MENKIGIIGLIVAMAICIIISLYGDYRLNRDTRLALQRMDHQGTITSDQLQRIKESYGVDKGTNSFWFGIRDKAGVGYEVVSVSKAGNRLTFDCVKIKDDNQVKPADYLVKTPAGEIINRYQLIVVKTPAVVVPIGTKDKGR